jgi:RNA polymerase sigma-70 factor (ECF subfamily)
MTPDAGDDRARWVREALDRFEGPLVQYASRLLRDVHAARDVVQETFLRLCREDRAKVEPILAPWLYTVCRNRATDERRKGRRMARTNDATLEARNGPGPSAPPDAAPDLAAERDDEAARALRAIDALPEAQQEVLVLKFRHGLSYRDIASVTDLSVSHVGVLIHEGVRALRARLNAPAPTRAVAKGVTR